MLLVSDGRSWPHYEKIAFRFLFVFFLLFVLFFNNGALFFLRPFELLLKVSCSDTVAWVGQHVLSLEGVEYGRANGSGDTAFNYVLLFCICILSVLSAAVWSAMDWRRPAYRKLFYWLTTLIRYYVGLMLIQYGLAKVMGGQFVSPDVVRLSQSFGESTPMGLAWTFFGFSTGYKWFMAIAEFMGVLLLFRRTMVLGAVIGLGTAANIMAVNYFFDVPVKIVSTALVVMCLYLLMIHSKPLFRFFFLGKASSLPVLHNPFRKQWEFYTKNVLKGLLVLITVSFSVYSMSRMKEHYTIKPAPVPVAGLHKVVGFNHEGKPEKNGNSWAKLRLVNNTATLHYRNGSSVTCLYSIYPEQNKLELFVNGSLTDSEVYTYRREANGDMLLHGTHQQKAVEVRLRKAQTSEFRLMESGFHWISERPNNR